MKNNYFHSYSHSQTQTPTRKNEAVNVPSVPEFHDSNGDVLSDSLHSYAWNVETRPTTIDTVTVTYDALGRMVEQGKSGSNTEIVYGPTGNKLALMNGISTLVKGFALLPGGATAVYNGSGLQYYRHPDWLGSGRFASTPSRTMYNDLAYAPFGEQYAQAGSTGVTDTSFGGNNQDTTTNLYDAMYREYGIQGRWPSPDPLGVAAVNPGNPQTWNRYAYVYNNPLLLTDVSGALTGCYLTQMVPADTSQQTSGGPYDAGEDEMYAPPEGGGGGEGCGGFDSPFGGGSGEDSIGIDFGFGPSSLCTAAGCAQCPDSGCSGGTYVCDANGCSGNSSDYECDAANNCGYGKFYNIGLTPSTPPANDENCIATGLESTFAGSSVTMGSSTGETGGHWNFNFQLQFSSYSDAASFVNSYSTSAGGGWPPPARFGSGPALHVENLGSWSVTDGTYSIDATAHIDLFSPNPSSIGGGGLGGLVGHIFVDWLVGHIVQFSGGNIDPRTCPY